MSNILLRSSAIALLAIGISYTAGVYAATTSTDLSPPRPSAAPDSSTFPTRSPTGLMLCCYAQPTTNNAQVGDTTSGNPVKYTCNNGYLTQISQNNNAMGNASKMVSGVLCATSTLKCVWVPTANTCPASPPAGAPSG